MDTHKNAPLTPKGREAMVRSVVEEGLSHAAAARKFNVTPKTVAKWVKRFRAEGVGGLRDHSSRPHSLPGQTPAATCATVEALRRQRFTGKEKGPNPEMTIGRANRHIRLRARNRTLTPHSGSPAFLKPSANLVRSSDRRIGYTSLRFETHNEGSSSRKWAIASCASFV